MLSRGKSAIHIAASQYHITANFIMMCYHKVARSRYRKIADRSIALSQNRRSLQSLNGYVFFYATLRYAICDIAYRRFFKVFQRERFLMHAMRWISRRNLTVYDFYSSGNILYSFARCDVSLRSKIHEP